ncbi:hypothetical protein D2E25_0114 [Bifidobacterium goeldii]|uniref:Protein ylxX/ylxW n=1 Tax=Bifidobacterium goeldii TaxID=2306975 RepID=A0A430FM47_9BIFI|nr:DUF881 domain-containing protein [Bifidobacterium goeldii]RSX53808.1 hypothetical protein D2E25_0114 [Bifidobacterium goeldii]
MSEPMTPLSFPVPPDRTPVKRRAVFSASVAQADSRHAESPSVGGGTTRRRRKLPDDSLKLIDDLTNRPMDPMFSDSRLGTRQRGRSVWSIWATRVIVFIICVGVGFYGCLFIQSLHSDPRKIVRQSLASELRETKAQAESITQDVTSLRAQIDAESKKLGATTDNPTLITDEMTNGALAVEGEGITLTIADPIAANGDSAGSSARENSSSQIRVVTDADLRLLVRLLWQSGAEAIAINGNRLGVQTSVRKAGSNILVGVTPVTSPYTIEAIGNSTQLAQSVSKQTQKSLYDSFAQAGIYPQVSETKSITLEAAASGDLTYAKGLE